MARAQESTVRQVAFLLALVAFGTAAAQDLDFGDAPDSSVSPIFSYPTLLADDGARHQVPAEPTHFLAGPHQWTIDRVSVDTSGVEANSNCYKPAISADGAVVAFVSGSSNLVPDDTNGKYDVFVHDRSSGVTSRVSVDSAGVQSNGHSVYADAFPAISADGRFVAFHSAATNLVPGDSNGEHDAFVHDRSTGETSRVSVDSNGVQGNGSSARPAISADGRYVAFESWASNLVVGDSNGVRDIFVHDRSTGETTRLSVATNGMEGNGTSEYPAITSDGNMVAFTSFASNLVSGDTNSWGDYFLHDRSTGETLSATAGSQFSSGFAWFYELSISDDGSLAFASHATNLVPDDTNGTTDVFLFDVTSGDMSRISVTQDGVEGNDRSYGPSISNDGRWVAFHSRAANLVPLDTNGGPDVFVKDRSTGEILRASVDANGAQANNRSLDPSVSSDGGFLAFSSDASNLVADDTNDALDVFVTHLNLGLDSELDGLPSAGALGDDADGERDEGGAIFPCCMTPGGTATLQVGASAAGYVNAWVDFDRDGDWFGPGEQILVDEAVLAGINDVVFSVPAGDEISPTFARVRFTSYDTGAALLVTGEAADGEVEDYWILGSALFADGFESGDTSGW